MAPRRDCKVKQWCWFRLRLPVSLFENEALLFDPGPPALSTHPLPCVNHSRRETYTGRGKNAFQTDPCNGLNICMTEHLDKSSEAFQRPGNLQSNYLCIAAAQGFLHCHFVSQYNIGNYNIF